jgi:hypothetical protein
MKKQEYVIKITKTLYDNMYRCLVNDAEENIIGHLRVVPNMPLNRKLVPKDAPEVPPFLLVIVDDADINKDNLIDFEERTSFSLLKKFSTENWVPQHCQFYYPSPAFVFEQEDSTNKPFQ